jgi:HSP20 family protein
MIGSGYRGGKNVTRGLGYPMLSLFDEMNRFFEEALPVAQATRSHTPFKPRIDITETEKEYVIQGEFPGLEAADVSLELKENCLTLSGEKRIQHEHQEGNRVHIERSFGCLSRAIPFKIEVDEDNATAEMKNGVLTVRVPKSSKAVKGVKKLSIKAL